jgi:sporulation protein YlmC with PRC-barrel domain/protein tyrosine phosphatase (PTP) superfamily phosphohydrolase (DUF442 family)
MIIDGLYIAAWPTQEDVALIKSLGVRLIICMDWVKPDAVLDEAPLHLISISFRDLGPFTSIPMPEVRQGVETALPVLQAGDGVMVYCKAGINRSPMMACCILIASGYSAEEAMALVKERRPVANPYHPTYRKQILKFEQQWSERQTDNLKRERSIAIESEHISIHAEVRCSDGVVGHSVYIVGNPVSDEVTHIVVKTKDKAKEYMLVPLDLISDSDSQGISLKCSRAEFFQLEPFFRERFVEYDYADDAGPTGIPETHAANTLLLPYAVPASQTQPYPEKQIPPNELAVHRGAKVMATDGEVGRVSELVLNAQNHQVIYLVMRKGHLYEKDVTIPVSDVERAEEDVVYLKLDKAAVKALPSVSVKLLGWKR